MRNSRRSSKCGCLAKFRFDAELGIVSVGEHSDLCLPLEEIEFQRKGYVMKNLQSPDKQSGLQLSRHLSFGLGIEFFVSQIIEKEVMKKSYSLTNNSKVPPPRSYIKGIIHIAKKKLHSSINPKDGVAKLLEYLMENDMKHLFLQDDMGCIAAVSFYDPVLAPTPHEACAVYTSDVTFGITDQASGISKWSFFSRLTAGKTVDFNCTLNEI